MSNVKSSPDLRKLTSEQTSRMLRKIADAIDKSEIPWDPEGVCYHEATRKGRFALEMLHTRLEIRWTDVQPVLTEIAYKEGIWYLSN